MKSKSLKIIRERQRREGFYVVCDNIRSLENVGSIFRTADALGVTKMYLCGITGRPPEAKISKTALGAEKTIPWEYHKQTWRLIERLQKQKINIISLEQTKNSILYTKFKPTFPLALVIGNEVKGVSLKALKQSDKVIHLPMRGKKESLNVSVAFGVAGYQILKKP